MSAIYICTQGMTFYRGRENYSHFVKAGSVVEVRYILPSVDQLERSGAWWAPCEFVNGDTYHLAIHDLEQFHRRFRRFT